jgi:hypothetical protein
MKRDARIAVPVKATFTGNNATPQRFSVIQLGGQAVSGSRHGVE